MVATKKSPSRSVRVTRQFAAPRDKVFRAFTQAEAIKVWFAPPPLSWSEPPVIDARAGGRYSFRVEEGPIRWHIHGEYKEVVPPEKLVFTWLWEDDPLHHESGDTLVTILFLDRGGRTEVILTQEKLPSEVARTDHEGGWKECLESIAGIVE